MTVFITGDSHTGALNLGRKSWRSARSRKPRPRFVCLPLAGGHILPTPFFRDAGTHAEIVDPASRKHLTAIPPSLDHPVEAVILSMPLWPVRIINALVYSDWCLSARIGDRHPVSFGTFRQMVLADQRYVLDLIDLLIRVGLPVAAVSPPHLFADHASLKFLEPENVKLMFRSGQQIMRDELMKRGAATIEVPMHCLGPDGLMKPQYRHPDPEDDHHANASFGTLMLGEIETWWNQLRKEGRVGPGRFGVAGPPPDGRVSLPATLPRQRRGFAGAWSSWRNRG